MSLRLPSEIIVSEVLPTLRVLLARKLDDHGFTQQSIAQRLGVTQAAVSKYLDDEATVESTIASHEGVKRTVERIASGFATKEMDEYEALAELLSLIRELEDRGPICELHEEAMPALDGLGCDLCVRGPDEAVQAERTVLSAVREAVRTIAATPAFTEHVPNVGTNIGMALPDATNETDVAAVPGRLHAMGGRINVPSNPEFGASQHVAGTILTAMETDSSIRAALNFKTSDALLAAARNTGFEPRVFEADYDNREETLAALFEKHGVPRVIYHEGAFGIEPMTYVFGETAVDAVETARTLVERVD